MISGLLPCLGAIYIVHIPQAWPIHPWVHRHIHSPRESCTQRTLWPACAALWCCSQLASPVKKLCNQPPVARCIFLMGLFRYQSSCYSEKVHSRNRSINPHLTAPKKKRRKNSPLDLNPIRAFSFEIWLANTATRRDGESAAFHDDSHIISHKSRHE